MPGITSSAAKRYISEGHAINVCKIPLPTDFLRTQCLERTAPVVVTPGAQQTLHARPDALLERVRSVVADAGAGHYFVGRAASLPLGAYQLHPGAQRGR